MKKKVLLLIALLLPLMANAQSNDDIETNEEIDSLITAAKNGDSKAMFSLGRYYLVDEKNINKAIPYLEQAAKNDHTFAQLTLGVSYYRGLYGIEKDVNKAVPYLKQAAEKGDVDAQLYLGTIYYKGESGNKDEKTALLWFDKAAAQGNEYAINFKKKYQREHESYWESRENWRMVFPNGLIVTQYGDAGIKTNNFRLRVYSANLSKEEYDKILNGEKKFRTDTDIRHYIIVEESSLDYYSSLTDNQKNELLKKEMSIVSFEGKGYVCTHYYPGGVVESNTYDGTFENGKFISMSARLASLTKRFGFNPQDAASRKIITPGRSTALIDDYSNFCHDIGETFYKFELAANDGVTKRFRLYWGSGGNWVGTIWVKGGKVTSVTWH